MDILITVETDRFDHKNVKPHFINPCCFGEDCAAWLKNELLPLEGSGFKFSEPLQEDYGWGLWASNGKDRFWIAISYVGSGPQEPPAQWVISVALDSGVSPFKRLFHKPDWKAFQQLRTSVREAIRSAPELRVVESPS